MLINLLLDTNSVNWTSLKSRFDLELTELVRDKLKELISSLLLLTGNGGGELRMSTIEGLREDDADDIDE